jgi:sugar phosphate isomerase/epimerase
MTLSVTTDYVTSTGNPGPYLKGIADAGFSHIHWCHQWNTDFLYSRWEIDQIAGWLENCGLQLLDLHASVGPEKTWSSTLEYERKSGVELVANRIDMAARLDCEVIIMHTPGEPDDPAAKETYLDPLRRSLDELEPIAREKKVRIAVENGDFRTLRRLFDTYPPDYLGLCYDSGHGNMIPDGLDHLDSLKDRLISVHLHDNDGEGDQHNLLFTGTVDWSRLAAIMASSGYEKCASMEVVMRNADTDSEEEFLKRAYATGTELTGMIAGHKR